MDPAHENRRLRQVLDVARQMAATTDLDVLLGTIIEAACRVLECERATIFLHDKESHELYSRVATGDQTIRFPADRGIAGAAASSRSIVNVPDAYADGRFNPDIDRRTGFRTRSVLAVPMESFDGELVGVLQALNKHDGPFGEHDVEMAAVFSAQAGVAVHRWFLLQAYAEKLRFVRDMDIARQIQMAIFPDEDPKVAGYEIAGWSKPADETGGDCYDFFPLPDGRLAILVADATGHGIGAALITAQCRSLLRAMLSVTDDLSTIASRVNDLLVEDLSENRFVTAFFGLLDAREHRIDYIAGGQGPLIMVAPDGRTDVRRASGLPFAVIPDAPYTPPDPFRFAPGSTLVLATDGFYETTDPQFDLFGERRVIDVVRSGADLPPKQVIERLHAAVLGFRAGRRQEDDLTAVLVRRVG